MNAKMSADLLRGHTDTIILAILQNGDSYGYDIHKQIREKQEGAISAYWGDETQGARRKYYQITQAGRELFWRNKADWNFTKKIIDQLLGVNDDDQNS